MTIVIVLSCIGSNVLAGLLPGGGESGGYQYRPGGGFNDRFGGVGLGRGGGGDFGGSNFRDRPAGLYGAPAFGGDGNRGGGGGGGGRDFGGPSSTYGAPGFGTGGNRGYQGGFNGDYGRVRINDIYYTYICIYKILLYNFIMRIILYLTIAIKT